MIVFVDTSAIVGLLWSSDNRHQSATKIWHHLVQQRPVLVTSNLVMAEAVVVTRMRAGYELSVQVGERLRRPPFEMTYVDASLTERAWQLYLKYNDQLLSLCDCASFAIMQSRRIRKAFAFDGDFSVAGFEVLSIDSREE